MSCGCSWSPQKTSQTNTNDIQKEGIDMSRKNKNYPNPASLARYLRIHKGLSMQKLAAACSLQPT